DPVDAIVAVTLGGHPDSTGAGGDVAQLLAGSGHRYGGHDPGGGRVNPVDHARADNPYTPVTGRKFGDSRAQVGPADDDEPGSGPWRRMAGHGPRNRAPQVRGPRGRRYHYRDAQGHDPGPAPGSPANPPLDLRPRAGRYLVPRSLPVQGE